MSIYKFQDSEPTVTSSNTSTGTMPLATDPVLIFSGAKNRTAQGTVGSNAALWPVSTSTSTGTNISAFGLYVVTSASSAQWLLSTALQAGQCVAIFNSSSTSTANNVTTNTTASATFVATDSQLGTTLQFSKSGAYAELVSNSAGQWMVTGRSASGLTCT